MILRVIPGAEFSPSRQKRKVHFWKQEVTDVATQQLAKHKSMYQQVITGARIYF